MKTKKVLALVLALSMTMTGLVGCGAKEAESAAPAPAKEAAADEAPAKAEETLPLHTWRARIGFRMLNWNLARNSLKRQELRLIIRLFPLINMKVY